MLKSLRFQLLGLVMAWILLGGLLRGPFGRALGADVGDIMSALVASALIYFALHRLIVVRVNRVNAGLARVADGQLDHRLSSRWPDEIGALTRSIDELVGTLRSNYEELRTHDELRRRMVANVSHELRTPLTSIIGYLETTLNDQGVDPSTRQHMETCHREAKKLSRLVQDLFQLSKLDTHQLEFHFETVSLTEICDQVGLAFEQRFADKQIEFVTELPDDPLDVIADGNRLSQVVTNLLGNAAVFTAKGGRVTLRCLLRAGRVVCEVEDTGIGIASRDVPHIFESFFHLEKSRTRNLGGTGLGLAICKAIIDTHHGEIGVESREGEGTTFRFQLDPAPPLDDG